MCDPRVRAIVNLDLLDQNNGSLIKWTKGKSL